MTEVILDGRFAGMTQTDYDAMRELDCEVAVRLGYRPVLGFGEGSQATHWFLGGDPEPKLRDEEFGVPFYSDDMNGAYPVLKHALTEFRYSGKQIFFAELAKLGGYEGDGKPSYPDALISVVNELPTNICLAFIRTFEWCREHYLDLYNPSERSTSFAERTEKEVITEIDDDGVKHQRLMTRPPEDMIPPWVKA